VVNVRFALLAPGGEMASIAVVAAHALPLSPPAGRVAVTLAGALLVGGVVRLDLSRDVDAGLRHFLLALGGLVAFSAGASQVGLAVGPLVPLTVGTAIPVAALAAGGGVGLLLGSWTGAPRMIKAVAQDYSSLGPRRSISALLPSFAIAQVAVLFGIPVSFNQIVLSGIVGAGVAVGGGDVVSRRKIAVTVGAWTGSLLLAFAAGFGISLLFVA
jgi:PiT family inorganic phosphate transporter